MYFDIHNFYPLARSSMQTLTKLEGIGKVFYIKLPGKHTIKIFTNRTRRHTKGKLPMSLRSWQDRKFHTLH